jgi:hypothetical protein
VPQGRGGAALEQRRFLPDLLPLHLPQQAPDQRLRRLVLFQVDQSLLLRWYDLNRIFFREGLR